jgi:hypothetical protein
MAHATLCRSVQERNSPLKGGDTEICYKGGCQCVLTATSCLMQMNSITMHNGTQACFPGHSEVAATDQSIPVIPPRTTAPVGENRKL